MGEFATGIIGIFSSVSGVEFSPDRYLAVVYDEDSIDVIAALPGDANLDNTIDFDDLLAVAQNYDSGNISTWVQGCLLYTSDAADERSRLDLGGGGIFNK